MSFGVLLITDNQTDSASDDIDGGTEGNFIFFMLPEGVRLLQVLLYSIFDSISQISHQVVIVQVLYVHITYQKYN